jgi:hypothetical protein
VTCGPLLQVPRALADKVKSYCDYVIEREVQADEADIIAGLSASLRTQVILHLYQVRTAYSVHVCLQHDCVTRSAAGAAWHPQPPQQPCAAGIPMTGVAFSWLPVLIGLRLPRIAVVLIYQCCRWYLQEALQKVPFFR